MIDSNVCADCTKQTQQVAQAPPSPPPQLPQPHQQHTQQQQTLQLTKEYQTQAKYQFNRTNTNTNNNNRHFNRKRLNYFHANKAISNSPPQPLIPPAHLFHYGRLNSQLASAAGNQASLLSPISNSPIGGHHLTADARACVTATYLCVLIVNNTWLDCNLLDLLCNGASQAAGFHLDNPNLDKQFGEEQAQLDALEAGLEQLIASLGDEEDTGGGGDGGGRTGAGTSRVVNGTRQAGSNKEDSVANLTNSGRRQFNSRLAELQLSRASTQGRFYADSDGLNRLISHGNHKRVDQGADDDEPPDSSQLAQYINDEHKSQLEYYLHRLQSRLSPFELASVAGNNSASLKQATEETTPATSQASGGAAGSLISWMGRPFRGWSSYAFWSASNSPMSLDAAASEASAAAESTLGGNRQQQLVQILRPVDRSEHFGDIATNQSIDSFLSQMQPAMSSRDQQRDHRFEQVDSASSSIQQQDQQHINNLLAASSSSVSYGDLFTSTTGVNDNNQPTFLATASSLSVFGPASFTLNTQQPSELILDTANPTEPGCRFRCAISSSEAPGGSQGQGSGPVSSPQASVSQATMTNQGGVSTNSPITGTSSKMNPLDVNFHLYTRYHRDLARDLAQLGVSSGTAGNININTSNQNDNGNNNPASTSEIIDLTNETSFNESRLNSSLPIKIIIHGFGSGGRRPWVTEMVYKLLDFEDVNVIVVDWEKGAAMLNYVQAAGNTRIVGHRIACLIWAINNKFGLTGNSYHLIGFSLGAHVAGFAGMEIRNSTSVSRLWINRITGLDPASPLFEGYEANDRLDPSDAQFVDVIHSNGDGVLRGGFGSLQPMGHVDFYPNGGRVQVGCNSVLLSALSDIIYGKWQSLCNHRRALNFFMDSFESNKCRFRSFNCDSYENYLKGECFDCGYNNEKCSYMGYLANYSRGRGKMYLTTHEEAPFCGFKTHWDKVEVTLMTLDGKNESFWLSSVNQQSNDIVSQNGQKELSRHSMQSLIVAHPTLVEFTQIFLRYTKYKGWIYSGDESWAIDKVFIMDSDGQVKSYCGFNTILESHITTRLNLEPGNCTVIESSLSGVSANGNGPSSHLLPSSLGPQPNSGHQQQQQTNQASLVQIQQVARASRLFNGLSQVQLELPSGTLMKQQLQSKQNSPIHSSLPLLAF